MTTPNQKCKQMLWFRRPVARVATEILSALWPNTAAHGELDAAIFHRCCERRWILSSASPWPTRLYSLGPDHQNQGLIVPVLGRDRQEASTRAVSRRKRHLKKTREGYSLQAVKGTSRTGLGLMGGRGVCSSSAFVFASLVSLVPYFSPALPLPSPPTLSCSA